ncbi:MAG: hypothetical protein QNJ32_08510 [Xenococcaceae cyanobacterium MO_167.B27]|nr:hypothetical protein [Xenococcaceae cyanobacterium MO_167.B27]
MGTITTESQLELENFSMQKIQPESQPVMETHLVDRGDIFYTKGRNLAKEVYRDVWNTSKLIDGNDFGVIVTCNGEVLGNANIQLKGTDKLLKSEVFFGAKHWQSYFTVADSEIAEISALAIAQNAAEELRRPIMMMLITGIQNICRIQGIKYISTVQHSYLLRILRKSLGLPFFQNQVVNQPQANVPDDNYWNRGKLPAIYYLEPLSIDVVNACYSFFSYLNFSGIQTKFFPRIKQTSKLSYATFVKQWHQDSQINN